MDADTILAAATVAATTEFTKVVAKDLWEKVKTFFKDVSAGESIRLKMAYEDYLDNIKLRYGKVKTLINKYDPKELYTVFECLSVSHCGNDISTNTINNLIGRANKIVITGMGGTGKSTTMKHLLLNTVKETNLIPVYIELRSINSIVDEKISLQTVVYDALKDNGFSLEQKYFEESMAEGGYVILLDGFDEVKKEKVEIVSSEVKKLCEKYNKNKYIVTSRPADSFIGWHNFSEMQMLPLTKDQAISLIGRLDYNPEIKQAFISELKESLFEKYESFASNPLLLTIMLLTYDDNASIPDKLNDFYDQAFSTLFNRHDATKEVGYTRDIRTKLGAEDFKLVFSHFCFKSYLNSEYEFTEAQLHKYIKEAKEKTKKNNFLIEDFQDDLLRSVCMLVKDGLNYSFTHRSFQEYFAALYTCRLMDTEMNAVMTYLLNDQFVDNGSFFLMLHNMLGSRLNKVVLFPIIEKVKEVYDKQGFSIELLSGYVRTISVGNFYEDDKYGLSYMVIDELLSNAMDLICYLNDYDFSLFAECSSQETLKELDIADNYEEFTDMPFFASHTIREAVDIVGEEALLNCMHFIHEQLLFCFAVLERDSVSKNVDEDNIVDLLANL